MESHGDQPSDRRWYLMMMIVSKKEKKVKKSPIFHYDTYLQFSYLLNGSKAKLFF